ncbi:MAG: para-aminobenzoate synthase, (PABA) [Pleopsidium flavum]|nr:MAG: para-aminobenzoate synthase, (PABA) [Pleopsidium flavum]
MATEAPDPKTFTSWQAAFQYPIPAVRRMEAQLRGDVASGREKVRGLVGASYRDLLGTAESIVEMDETMRNVEKNLGILGRGCGARAVEVLVLADRERYAFASQLAVLQRCPLVITRLLRKRCSTLLAAKVLVISRLLYKSLAQGNGTPPFLDNLRLQLGSLRRKLLAHIDRRFADSNTGTNALVEAMCAFSLATSSLPKDVLRHFLHVRQEMLTVRLEKGGGGDGSVLVALRVYIRTLQDTQAVFPKRLAESLAKMKAQPLLKDADVRGLMELSLDVHERWIADEVRNFTPWVRDEDLQKTEAEKVLTEWARKAFAAFIGGFKKILESVEDLKELVQLRKKLLETWLSADSRSPGLSSSEVLDGLRAAINGQLGRVIRSRVDRLDLIGSEITGVIERWRPGLTDVHPSLWDQSMTSMEVSNGAAAFKQAILGRSHGRNEAVLRVLERYNLWSRSIEEVEHVIQGLKDTKWDVDLETDEDDELELDSKQALLSEDDPRELQEGFQKALGKALRDLENQIQEFAGSFAPEEKAQQAMFVLRVVREIRHRLRKHYETVRVGPVIVHDFQQMVVESVLKDPIRTFDRAMEKRSRTGRVVTRALWEGTPKLPVQPSPTVFKLLHGTVSAMAEAGSDIWSPDATDVLKKQLRANLLILLNRSLKPKSMDDKVNGIAGEEKEEDEPNGLNRPMIATNGDDGDTDWNIQLLFDASFIQKATMTNLETGEGGFNALVEKIHLEDGSLVRLHKAAEGYWKRTSLLFALLA